MEHAVRPVVVQHSFGNVGGGGPIGALTRLRKSSLAESFELHSMHQSRPLGGFDTALIREWVQYLRILRPDIVHVRGLGNEGFHAAAACRLAGVEHVLVSVHGTHRDLAMPSGLGAARSLTVRFGLEPTTLAMATHIATVSEYAARRPFISRWHRKLVGVVPNGVDVPAAPARQGLREVLTDCDVGEEDFVMMTVSRITSEKGFHDLAEALRLMNLPRQGREIVFVAVGNGAERPEIEAAFEGIPGLRPIFLGTRTDVVRLLSEADLFVFPTWHENLSNALLEAMSVGLPVVATAVGGNIEVVGADSGVLIPARSPARLAHALSSIVAAPERRATLGSSARQKVISRYTTQAMATGWAGIYREILGQT